MTLQRLLLISLVLVGFKAMAGNDRYRLILTDDPATTVMIGWNQTSGDDPVVYYGTTDFGKAWEQYPNQQTVTRKVYYKFMSNHFVKLTNLQPNTAYYFVIRDSKDVSRRFWFKTAPNTKERLSFIAGGDSRNNRDVRQFANRMVAKLKPHAVFFGGDMTNLDTLFEWRNWFSDWQLTIAEDGRMFPIVPARGNHEQSNKVIYNLFNTPSTAVYYALTFGDQLIRSYTLNSEITAGGNQRNWLEQDLKAHPAIDWKMAQYHKPMRPHVASKSEGNDEYTNWSSLFYNYGVRLVCESDSHSVKSTWPIKPCAGNSNCKEGFERDDKRGTVYVGEGCWGAPLRTSDDPKPWTRDTGSFNQFKLVFVDQFKIEVRTVIVKDPSAMKAVSNQNPFELPADLSLWKPKNGEKVVIHNEKYAAQRPEIAFKNLVNEQAVSATSPTEIQVAVKNPGIGIAAVEFKVDGQAIGVDTSEPFETSYQLSNGRHKIEATAYNSDYSAYDRKEVFVNAGSFVRTVRSQIATSKDDVEEGIDARGKLYYNSSDLEMGFDYGWTFFGTNQYIGLRFQNVALPKGAVITHAHIQFVAEDSQSNGVHLKIAANDVSNATEFSAPYAVSGRPRLPKTVSWRPSGWSKGALSAATRTPELSALLQALVNKKDWKYGNSMSFVLWDADNSRNRRKAYSYDKDPSKAAQLVVTYKIGSTERRLKAKLQVELENNSWDALVYPNPFKEELQVRLQSSLNTRFYLQLFKVLGAVQWQGYAESHAGVVKIPTQTLASGAYILYIKEEKSGKIITKKITK